MKLSRLVGEKAGQAGDIEIAGLTADSREVQPGFLFAALPGVKQDGAAFVAQAVERGAVAVLAGQALTAAVPVIRGEDPRRCLAQMAALYYRSQPETVVAVTGTNGKSSIVWFLRQIWQSLGRNAACVGTLGVTTRNGHYSGGLTTPDPVVLHRQIAALSNDGVTHLALEASSHGLVQRRLDGLKIAAGCFTNLSHDHLDYHPTVEDYFDAKMRLFRDLLAQGAPAVIDIDTEFGRKAADAARAAGLHVVSYGRSDADFRFSARAEDFSGQHVALETPAGAAAFDLPLIGDFQAENAVAAMALAVSLGAELAPATRAASQLKGAPGRLQPAGGDAGTAAFVDYAHTPDALRAAISALRPHTKGRIVTVFGCGGDRDRAKRAVMGRIAAELSDVAIVTDDNPRTEDPAFIRSEIMSACEGGIEIGDRREAIFHAAGLLQPGDVALVAGKGHESGQIVGNETLPFDDLSVTGEAMEARK
ncbi:MAG: UDP-N-acetylmuramoyl-L-alanyl-D-glutamate--2,6-diaminopimelate ligase [Minwuia sp.]|uniref:UDP-N-acetylmuramoyl-L-alanyl-D-glutamate--2, 6-diaminopimelate ligase n=1 Tax=Minwuia sp. TaxID=2493630 RepID=UPI003A87F40C